MKFEEKVKSMKVHEIVQAMIDGLNNKWVHIDMTTYGDVVDDICYGCAATSAVCQIANIKFQPKDIDDIIARSEFLNSSYEFLEEFESAINSLRRGYVEWFAISLMSMNLINNDERKIIHNCELPLPYLNNENWENKLTEYSKLVEFLKNNNL